jgi:putative copper resistance protein D
MAASLDSLIAVVRAVHLGVTIVLFGQFAFVLVLAPAREPLPHFVRTMAWSLAAALASALAWLALEALAMSGLPPREALSMGTLTTVVSQTRFGHVWLARMLLALALVLIVVALRRLRPDRTATLGLGGTLATLLLVTPAGMGHATVGQGVDELVHLGVDAGHLLAAGLWLGTLVPLIGVLERSRRAADIGSVRLAAAVTQRFSVLGIVSIAIILASGIANSCFMLHSLAALANSGYGRLLLAKVVLFAAIVAMAAVNRQRLTPRLVAGAPLDAAVALRALNRNALLECLLGFAIIAIVGRLGITMPPMHVH